MKADYLDWEYSRVLETLNSDRDLIIQEVR